MNSSPSPLATSDLDARTTAPTVLATGARPTPFPSPAAHARGTSAFVPLLLLTLAFTAWIAFQSVQLALEHRQLGVTAASLARSEQQSVAVRHALDALATATAKLAAAGNPNARKVVDELRSHGITINPAASAASP